MSASQSDVRPSLADYWRGLKVQARVLNALMIRELMMRYGRGNIGFLWLIVEPMLLCAGVVGLRWMIQGHQEHGVPLVALLLSGYMPLTLWRHLTNRGIFLLRRNIGMLYHTNITMLDTFVMSMCLEFVGCTFAFIVNYAALLLIGVVDPIQNYGLVIAGWCLMGILALGVGAVIAVVSEKYEAAERFMHRFNILSCRLADFSSWWTGCLTRSKSWHGICR
jgi:capsular polysaccharide transport system permease protein